jgi:hypothetical protein
LLSSLLAALTSFSFAHFVQSFHVHLFSIFGNKIHKENVSDQHEKQRQSGIA